MPTSQSRPAAGASIEQAILDHLHCAVLLFDGNLVLCHLNSAAEVLFAASARHLLGQSADALFSSAAPTTRRLSAAIARHQPFTERGISLIAADGHVKTLDATASPLSFGEREDWVLLELHQIDRQLRISREEQLLSLHQASQILIRGLAHEVRNPLGGLRGAAQLLEQELQELGALAVSDPAQADTAAPRAALGDYLRIIIAEADRLRALVERMSGPPQRPCHSLINIHDVLERVRNLILAEFPAGPQAVRDYDPSIPELQADSDRLIQVFLNLARNAACAAGPDGTLTLRTRVMRQFTIGARRYRLVMRIQVCDDGAGIPEDIRDTVFLPLVSGRPDGGGLGLTIAQELIAQHQGLIEYEREGLQTVFSVYLPLADQSDSADAQ